VAVAVESHQTLDGSSRGPGNDPLGSRLKSDEKEEMDDGRLLIVRLHHDYRAGIPQLK
jgi:hypothetical protein